MDFRMVVFLSIFYISFGPKTANATIFDVTSYGAVGDGETDDSDAFVRAWADLCRDGSNPTLIIPSGKIFLTSCMSFAGPCSSSTVHVMLLGNITAPKTIQGWKGCDSSGQLIVFESVQGLTINGPGQFDGQGSIWWPAKSAHLNGPSCNCPSMLRFQDCDGLQLSGTTHINSPKSHIHINGCQNVQIENLRISAPEDSANTDGIDISQSSHVIIQHSTIQTGDDCVAVGSGTYDIHVNGVSCGPGHGISIGSLGRDGSSAAVEQVHVKNCSIYGTQNGLRIKTVPFGQGYARGIVYENINLYNVGNPIIIDQHYCLDMLNHYCPAPPTAEAVQVSNVTYINVKGTSATKQAITFDCSEKVKCTEIYTNKVHITGEDVVAYCNNAQGNFIGTTPNIACN